jgi:hypothetical protein
MQRCIRLLMAIIARDVSLQQKRALRGSRARLTWINVQLGAALFHHIQAAGRS